MKHLIPLFLFISISINHHLQAQIYVDAFLGIHPTLTDEGNVTAHLNLAAGRQLGTRVGYGINLGLMTTLNVSTSSSFSMMGIQYRILDNNHRFFGKAEIGSLLSSSYSTDSFLKFTYDPSLDPYYRLNWGYRLGRVAIGMNYTYIATFTENIEEFDDNLGQYIPTDQIRMRDFHDVQIYVGISLDNYRVKRKK